MQTIHRETNLPGARLRVSPHEATIKRAHYHMAGGLARTSFIAGTLPRAGRDRGG